MYCNDFELNLLGFILTINWTYANDFEIACDLTKLLYAHLECHQSVPHWKTGLNFKLGMQISDFNLSGGCFGTDIIQNCTKWSNIGVHGLIFGPIFAKFHCASFSIRNNKEKLLYGPTKHTNVVFREKIFEKLHASYKSWKKQMFRYNLLKFNRFDYLWLHLIEIYYNLHRFT